MSNQIEEKFVAWRVQLGLILKINCFTCISGYRIKSLIQSIWYGIWVYDEIIINFKVGPSLDGTAIFVVQLVEFILT